MKNISLYISEALVTSKPIGTFDKYKYHPKTKEELIEAINIELKEGNEDLNCIDTSAITDMSQIFDNISGIDIDNHINIDVSEWDVHNVKDMQYMFYNCENFNCDLSKWDVSKVKDMDRMFFGCKSFNCDISNWNVSSVTNMSLMFQYCEKFNCDLSRWNVSNVTDMHMMFKECISFAGIGLENWDVSNIKNMLYMFQYCENLEPIYGATPKIKNGKLVKL